MTSNTTKGATTGSSALDHGRHQVNIGHLVMGLAFAGLVWALIQSDIVEVGDTRWLLPVPWVLAGTAGLLAMTLSARGPVRGPA